MSQNITIRILLVDDQPANLAVLDSVLAPLDAELVRVESGERALRELLEKDFAVVIMDVQMPTMSGFETAEMMRTHPRARTLPIIFMTAGSDDDFSLERAYALGAVDYLTRPFSPLALRAKVAVFIDLYRKGAELARHEERRHQAALRSKDQRIRLILGNISEYAFIGTDTARIVTEWEGGAEAITGWSGAGALGCSADLLFTPEDRAAGAPEAEAERALRLGRAEDRRWHVRQDGTRFYADGMTVPLRDEAGRHCGFAKIFRDATAERQAAERLARSETQLDESRERLTLLLESAGEGILGLDAQARCTFLNTAGAAMLGYSETELIGTTLHQHLHRRRPDGVRAAEDNGPIACAARAGQALRSEDVFWRKDGAPIPVALSLSPLVLKGKHGGAVLTFTDISERRSVETERSRLYREVRAANERMAEIFQRAPAFICVMRGPQHVFEMANQRFIDMVGGRALLGLGLCEALPEVADQGLCALLDTVYAGGEAAEGHNARIVLNGSDGSGVEHFVDFVYLALRDPDGQVTGVLVHGVDVTARTRATVMALGQRSALELAVTDAPLGDVLDVLAHTAEEIAGGAALVAVQLVSADRRTVAHAAAPALAPALIAAVDALGMAPLTGLCAAGARADCLRCVDIAEDPAWAPCRALALEHGLAGVCAIPILAPSGRLLGVFSWYYRDVRDVAGLEREAMALLANTASLVIGQRREAQERQAADDRSQAILESMSEGFIGADALGRITYVNSAAEAITERSRAALVGARLADLAPDVLGAHHLAAFGRSAALRERASAEAYLPGQARWFEINSFPTPDGGIALYLRDDTERRRAEEGVRRLAAVAEQSSDFIGIFTPAGGGVYLNPAGRRMAGLRGGADIGACRMADFFAPGSGAQVRDEVLPALAERGSWEGELRFAAAGGSAPLPVYYKGFAVRDGAGANIGMAAIMRDISEQKRAEDALRRVAADLAEADERKSAFLATLAHELRNPLAPIRTGIDLLRMGPVDTASAERVHTMMNRQLCHLVHLVDDLLDVARITRGKIALKTEPVDLRTVVAMAVETSTALVQASGHTLDVQVPEQPLALDADVTRLVQVLSNLLNNAAKYTPAGGRIAVRAAREGAWAVLTVTDNGVGIPPEALGSVFDMFTQVRSHAELAQGGLGIGLSLVQRLVRLHGGEVRAASAGRGHGSTFTVRLPLVTAPEARAQPDLSPAAELAPARRVLRVLVVDDNVDAAESLVALLGMLGHATEIAHDGPGGLAASHAFRPDLVFLDIGLPGMSGHEVARTIRATPGLDPVTLVALTGWGTPDDLHASRSAGFDQHLTKPVSLEALEQACLAAGVPA